MMRNLETTHMRREEALYCTDKPENMKERRDFIVVTESSE